MKALNEESIAQIDDVEELRYLLSGVVQKNAKQLKRLRVTQRQLKSAKSELQSLSDSHASLSIENESNRLYKFERDFEKIRADFNEFSFAELFEIIQNQTFENSDFFRSQVDRYQKEFKKVQSDQIDEFRRLIADKDAELLKQRHKIEELRNELDAQQAAPLSKDIEKAMTEKDQSILKLRAMVQRYSKSDQAKQEEIETQRQEIRRLSTLIADQQTLPQSSSIDRAAKLEREISELQSQLTNSSTSRQLEAKCEKLAAMLDRSNRLYSDLNAKYQLLAGQADHKSGHLVAQFSQFYELFRAVPKSGSKSAVNSEVAVLASLRKTILQYFLADLRDQEHLVPVILEIVGCSPDQIQAAVRNVRSNQQIVNRVGGVFSFFGG